MEICPVLSLNEKAAWPFIVAAPVRVSKRNLTLLGLALQAIENFMGASKSAVGKVTVNGIGCSPRLANIEVLP